MGVGGSELNATMQFDDAPIVSDGYVISAKPLKMHVRHSVCLAQILGTVYILPVATCHERCGLNGMVPLDHIL